MKEKTYVTVDLGQLTTNCFVIMPFSPLYQNLYERVIRPAIELAGLNPVRADEIFSKPQITNDIWNQIRSSRLVIAELTGKNPNVLYELGIAHAIGKPSIIITRVEEDVPFDLRALRYLYYDTNDPEWGESLKSQLTGMCTKILEQEDFGSVFDSILLHGEKSMMSVPQLKMESAKYNLTGLWQGEFTFQLTKSLYSWNLQLIQHEDNSLSGTLIVSHISQEKLTVVKQSISGFIRDSDVSFAATTYSFLEQGVSKSWNLDRFSGKVLDGGNVIDGFTFDDKMSTAGKLVRQTK